MTIMETRHSSRFPRIVVFGVCLSLLALVRTEQQKPPQQVSDDECDCFLTNGTNQMYLSTHRFFDFRSLSQYADVPGPINNPRNSSLAPATSDYFLSDAWTGTWITQHWNNSDSTDDQLLLMTNSPNNIYISPNTDPSPLSETFLTLRTIRLSKTHQSAAEFQSVTSDYHHMSLRMLARTVGPPGAITAMFTYDEDIDEQADLADVQESDLEIRTKDPRDSLQYTNQPSYTANGANGQGGREIPEATRNVSLSDFTPSSSSSGDNNNGNNESAADNLDLSHLGWDSWLEHRMDWSPSSVEWYVQGRQVASIAFQTPRAPCKLHFNAWSDGGDWSGLMPVRQQNQKTDGGDERDWGAYLEIQWIEMVYNTTADTAQAQAQAVVGKRAGEDTAAGCKRVCSVDETQDAGSTVLLYEGGASSTTAGRTSGLLTAAAVVMVMMWWL